MTSDIFQDVIKTIKEEDNIYIVSHYLPDGDSVGSSLALAKSLINQKKNVFLYCRDPIPQKYIFLDGDNLLSTHYVAPCADSVLLVLDCSDITRTGIDEKEREIFKKVVNIDHHITNDFFADINLVVPEASATGEIVFDILKRAGLHIDDSIARCLYVSIVTDTGSFKYENTTSTTHQIVSELLKHNINLSQLSQDIFDDKPLEYYFLLKKVLSTLELYENGKIATITISHNMLMEAGTDLETIDGMVNYAKNITDVEIGIIFYIASSDEIKVGLRSKNVDVSEIAAQFNGGGHIRAAGFRAKGAYPEVKEKTLISAILLIDKLNKLF